MRVRDNVTARAGFCVPIRACKGSGFGSFHLNLWSVERSHADGAV